MQQFLSEELAKRSSRNPHYSLRSFAKFLEISPTSLSRVLTGNRQLSAASFMKVSSRLGLTLEESERLRPNAEPTAANELIGQAEVEALHRDWCSFAILELIAVKDFKPECKWIASRLGVSIHRVRNVVSQLIQAEIIKITDDGKWVDALGESSALTGRAPSRDRRALVKDRLELASQAVDHVPFNERDHSFVTLAMRKDKIDEAREILKKCRREMMKLAQSPPEYEEVYHLDIAFFPVSHPRPKNQSMKNTKLKTQK